MVRVRVCSALALVVAVSLAHGQTMPEDWRARRLRIEGEIEALQRGPEMKTLTDLQKELEALNRQRDEIRSRAITLRETPPYRELQEQIEALYFNVSEEEVRQRREMKELGRQMYGARHAELAAMPKPPVPNGRALGFDVLTFPRLDGSTSTHPLVVIIASRLLDVPYDWHYAELSDRNYAGVRVPAYPRELLLNDLPVSHDDTPMELTAARVYAGGETERQRRIASLINSDLASNTHTHQSYENLINGTRDLIFVGRAPSEDELRLAREKGVELELSPVATDALVFIVHEDNPVKNLSIEQLRGAYRKTFRNWEEVGGTSDEIVPLAREKNSGSRELFDSLKVMGDEPLNYEPGQLYAEGMMGPYNMIMQSRGGLGYSLFYFEHFMAMSPYTRTIAIDGVEPTLASLASGQYRFAKPVYAAIRKTDTPQSAGRRLVAWLVSPEGQAVVRESGYLPFHR